MTSRRSRPQAHANFCKNIQCAHRLGWRTVLIGLVERDSGKPFECAEADCHIARLHDLRSVAPDLFEA